MRYAVQHAKQVLLGMFILPALGIVAAGHRTATGNMWVPPSPTPTLTATPILLPSATATPTHSPRPTKTPSPTTTPTITPTPFPPVTGQQMDAWFDSYSRQYGVDRGSLWKIAVCESGLNPQAHNRTYVGLYQFAPSTWQTMRRQMSLDPDPDLRYNAEESIRTAAYKISVSGLGAWPECSGKL